MEPLEQKIKNTEEKKSKEPWELEAKDFIPVTGMFRQSNRTIEYYKNNSKNGGVPLKTAINYSFHYLPRRAFIIFYNLAFIEAMLTAGDKIYQQF